jgi:hypothetical protein
LVILTGSTPQAVEVVAQGFAGKKNCRNAQSAPSNFRRNEVLAAFVYLRLSDIPDRCLMNMMSAGHGALRYRNLAADFISRRNRKYDLVANSDVERQHPENAHIDPVGQDTNGRISLTVHANNTFPRESKCHSPQRLCFRHSGALGEKGSGCHGKRRTSSNGGFTRSQTSSKSHENWSPSR